MTDGSPERRDTSRSRRPGRKLWVGTGTPPRHEPRELLSSAPLRRTPKDTESHLPAGGPAQGHLSRDDVRQGPGQGRKCCLGLHSEAAETLWLSFRPGSRRRHVMCLSQLPKSHASIRMISDASARHGTWNWSWRCALLFRTGCNLQHI